MVAKIAPNRSNHPALTNVELEIYPEDLAQILLPCYDGAGRQQEAGYVDISVKSYPRYIEPQFDEDPDEKRFSFKGDLVILGDRRGWRHHLVDISFCIGEIIKGDDGYDAFLKEYEETQWVHPLRYELTGEFFSELLKVGGNYNRLPMQGSCYWDQTQGTCDTSDLILVEFTTVLRGEFSPKSNWKERVRA